MYEYFKALHIIFIVTWFSGLFYIVRLFIYHTEAEDFETRKKDVLQAQFKIMEKRLWLGITWPSALLATFFGLGLSHYFLPFSDHPWLAVKLLFVLGLWGYQFKCHQMYKKLQGDKIEYSSQYLRVWNEVATIFLIAIVFLVVLKNLMGLVQGLIGLFVVMILLMTAIKIYRKRRLSNT